MLFNEAIKNNVSKEQLLNFYEVAEVINDIVCNKKIFNQSDS